MKNLCGVFGKEITLAYAELGKTDWLQSYRLPNGRTGHLARITHEFSSSSVAAAHLTNIIKRSEIGYEVYFHYALSKLISNGPKILRPTVKQCEALRNTEIKIKFAEYRQPYPATLIELPVEFRQQITQEFNFECYPYILSIHDPSLELIYCGSSFLASKKAEQGLLLTGRPEYENIEDALIKTEHVQIDGRTRKEREVIQLPEDGTDFKVGKITQRLAINFSLMMTMFGVVNKGKLESEPVIKSHARKAKSKDKEIALAGRALNKGSISLIEFDRNIKFYEDRTSHSGGGGSGESNIKVSPHWRKGHWRTQRFGVSLAERKTIFICPVFVNKDLFAGELSDTTTTYTSK
jgi:hypothetical protein